MVKHFTGLIFFPQLRKLRTMSTNINAARVSKVIERLERNLAREDSKTVFGRYRMYAVGNALTRWKTRNGMKQDFMIPSALDAFIEDMDQARKSAVPRSGTAAGYEAVYRALVRLREKAGRSK